MNHIHAAIMGRMSVDEALDRETLRAAVMRAITCAVSGKVLDVRTAVHVQVTAPSGQTGYQVIDGSVWDAHRQTIETVCADSGAILTVIDGRAV